MSRTVGFAGLGRMGGRVAARLAENHRLIVFNRTRTTAEDFAASHDARIAETPAELASAADTVVVMVAGDDAVRSVFTGPSGIVSGIGPRQLVLSLSTISPALSAELAGAVHAAGGRFVAAPVTGAPPQAAKGELTVIAGGEGPDITDSLPVLESIAARIIRLPGPRDAAVLKIVFNLIIHDLNLALAEGLALAERSGVDRRTAYDLLASGALACPFVINKRRIFEDPDLDSVGGATIRLAEDDLRMAIELADAVSLPLRLTGVGRQLLGQAAGMGLGDRDESAVIQTLADASARSS